MQVKGEVHTWYVLFLLLVSLLLIRITSPSHISSNPPDHHPRPPPFYPYSSVIYSNKLNYSLLKCYD